MTECRTIKAKIFPYVEMMTKTIHTETKHFTILKTYPKPAHTFTKNHKACTPPNFRKKQHELDDA